jgi:hypothetical protein
MIKRETHAIADIYVPVKRRASLDQKRVDEIAANMLDKGQQAAVLVRAGSFVLVKGLQARSREDARRKTYRRL